MKRFYFVLANSLTAFLINTFVWFAVTFWVYLETRSVVATAVMAGIYTSTVALSGLFLRSLVDRYPKKNVMQHYRNGDPGRGISAPQSVE